MSVGPLVKLFRKFIDITVSIYHRDNFTDNISEGRKLTEFNSLETFVCPWFSLDVNWHSTVHPYIKFQNKGEGM